MKKLSESLQELTNHVTNMEKKVAGVEKETTDVSGQNKWTRNGPNKWTGGGIKRGPGWAS